jgi:hypothetical protein
MTEKNRPFTVGQRVITHQEEHGVIDHKNESSLPDDYWVKLDGYSNPYPYRTRELRPENPIFNIKIDRMLTFPWEAYQEAYQQVSTAFNAGSEMLPLKVRCERLSQQNPLVGTMFILYLKSVQKVGEFDAAKRGDPLWIKEYLKAFGVVQAVQGALAMLIAAEESQATDEATNLKLRLQSLRSLLQLAFQNELMISYSDRINAETLDKILTGESQPLTDEEMQDLIQAWAKAKQKP